LLLAAAVRQQAASSTELEAAAAVRQAVLVACPADHCRPCLDQTAALETQRAAALMLVEAVAAAREVRAATQAVLVAMPGLAVSVACQRSRGRLSPTRVVAVAELTHRPRGTAREVPVVAATAAQTPLRAQMARQTPEEVLAVLALRQVSPLDVQAAPALSS